MAMMGYPYKADMENEMQGRPEERVCEQFNKTRDKYEAMREAIGIYANGTGKRKCNDYKEGMLRGYDGVAWGFITCTGKKGREREEERRERGEEEGRGGRERRKGEEEGRGEGKKKGGRGERRKGEEEGRGGRERRKGEERGRRKEGEGRRGEEERREREEEKKRGGEEEREEGKKGRIKKGKQRYYCR